MSHPRDKFRILAIGAIYQDVILHVPRYPDEDTKLRATSQERRLGGNVINTLIVLREVLKRELADTSWGMWVVGSVGEGAFATAEMEKRGMVPLVWRHEGETATAYIISAATGSRSIVTANSIPDPTYAQAVELINSPMGPAPRGYDWYHIEGRNCDVVLELLDTALEKVDGIISVEFERPGRPGLEALLPKSDVLFISELWIKYFLSDHDLSNDDDMMRVFLQKLSDLDGPGTEPVRNRIGFVTLGSRGCAAFRTNSHHGVNKFGVLGTAEEKVQYLPDFGRWLYMLLPAPPLRDGEKIVESTGAGDTFIAAVIFALSVWRLSPFDAAKVGNWVAGRKCCRRGFQGVWEGLDVRLVKEMDGGILRLVE